MTGQTGMSASEFAAKWQRNTRTEKAASQEHFIDLCRMLGEPTPNEADPDGEWYAFEKGAEKTTGGGGFADVWKRKHFGWEYKGKHKDLDAAYRQLLLYREALENPPLLVVCDLDRFEIHTNFTNTKREEHTFSLADLRDNPAEPLRLLRAVMQDPESLRPGPTREEVTRQAASGFAELAFRLRSRGDEPERVAHFLNRILFCFFAEDVGLLPRGLLARLIEGARSRSAVLEKGLSNLFDQMSSGGMFGADAIEWFDGGLFDDPEVLPLHRDEIGTIAAASKLDWSQIEPAILGTLFERALDPDKRGQLGAHYTDPRSILRVVEPVVMQPLRREYDTMKGRVKELVASGKRITARRKPENNPVRVFEAFLERLRAVRVLDPACGSGNFLYVALQLLKDLEREALIWGSETLGRPQGFPEVGLEVVLGLEVNAYAAELARVSIWIGEIQWMIEHGVGYSRDPVLRPLGNIECRDAVLDLSDPENPRAADWPEAEFVIGNPPFLGSKLLRSDLGDEYVEKLFQVWDGLVSREADFVCYWHEKGRSQVEDGVTQRVGLLATNSIRGGANREVLKRIKNTGDLFMAWSDEPWILDGAAVRVSIVGQDDGSEKARRLDGKRVEIIHPDLTGGSSETVDLSTAVRLPGNGDVAFMGDTKGGPFDISRESAREMLLAAGNVNGRPNSDVVLPWTNGQDITRRSREMFIVDFGREMAEQEAAQYEVPFEYVRTHVQPIRSRNRRAAYRERWWIHVEPRPAMRDEFRELERFIVTPTVAKHRLFVWQRHPTLPDHQLIAIARNDDYAFGVLHSRVHELWSLRKGTSLEDRPRYTPTTTFCDLPVSVAVGFAG